MTDLKHIYRQAAVGRIAELEAGLAGLKQQDTNAVETVRRIAHSLRGSGATYGFPEVSAAAGDVEEGSTAALPELVATLVTVLNGIVNTGQKTVRVLIVDDDPEIVLLLRAVLSAPGRDVATAESGREADTMLQRGPYALIILDLLLPDADGRDILRRIRGNTMFERTPVIVLSAKTATATRQECEALGATAFFEKPFDPDAVAAAVNAQLLRNADTELDTL